MNSDNDQAARGGHDSSERPDTAEFPARIPSYIRNLLEKNPDHGFRKQVIPSAEERNRKPYELADPLGESRFSPVPRLVHRYPNRALLLVTDTCALHCRFCFRRNSFTARGIGTVSDEDLDRVCSYLAEHREMEELLLSGGDPLMVGDRALESVIGKIRSVRSDIVLRLCTRIPVAHPARVTHDLCAMLRRNQPVWAVVHCNHPDELTRQSIDAIGGFVDSGIPVVSQTVLLAGVNDSAEMLSRLFQRLLSIRVKPYQLFQTDLAPGISHFRVPIRRGLEIVAALRKRISNLAMPLYSLDLPGGGGKIPLDESVLETQSGEWYELTSPHETDHEHVVYRYPADSETEIEPGEPDG